VIKLASKRRQERFMSGSIGVVVKEVRQYRSPIVSISCAIAQKRFASSACTRFARDTRDPRDLVAPMPGKVSVPGHENGA
jgi:hypothetical protein